MARASQGAETPGLADHRARITSRAGRDGYCWQNTFCAGQMWISDSAAVVGNEHLNGVPGPTTLTSVM